MSTTITTEGGTTVSLQASEHGQEVVLDHPDAPSDARNIVAGRLVDGGFQVPFIAPPIAYRPATLRAIAQLIEEN